MDDLDLCPDEWTKDQERRRIKRENLKVALGDHVHQVGIFWSVVKMSPTCLLRLGIMNEFFTADRLRRVVIPIISIASRISLRALDWFVINYAKSRRLVLLSSKKTLIHVYTNYRAWLGFWERPMYDAFRRGKRVYFSLDGRTHSTTVAQLNYLYWAMITGVLQYVVDHVDIIDADMHARIAECKALKKKDPIVGGKRRRSELAKSTPAKCIVYHVPQIVSL